MRTVSTVASGFSVTRGAPGSKACPGTAWMAATMPLRGAEIVNSIFMASITASG